MLWVNVLVLCWMDEMMWEVLVELKKRLISEAVGGS